MRLWLTGLVLAGCHGKGDDSGATPTDAGFRVATFNAGLAVGFVDGADSRTPLVADAVAGIDADVVCLQEVWLPEQVSAVKEASQGAFPNQSFPDPLPSDLQAGPACADGDLDDVLGCVDQNCADACTDELVDCVFASCVGPFITLPKPCQGCVMAEVGQEVSEVEGVCETVPEAYAYGNSFGIGLLSKHPLRSVEQLTFTSTTNRRAAIHAVVEAPDGDVDVYCTHLTAILTGIPYPHETGSWAEESGQQVDQFVQWIADTRSSTRLVVVAGDMNSGPAIGADIAAEAPENYQKFVDAGYADPYVAGDPQCTYCAANPLVDDASPSVILDHVFRVDAADYVSAERIFTDELTAQSCGADIPAALSDHYGLLVAF